MQKLDSIVKEPAGGPANACTIIVHGLGANGHDMDALASRLRLPADVRMRYVLPHAPMRKVTLNHGLPANSWFDIKQIDYSDKSINFDEFTQSVNALLDLINKQTTTGIHSQRVFIMGFSQGAAVALHAAMLCGKRLAGAAGLSCYLPAFTQSQEYATEVNKGLPIFLGHGHQDTVIPLDMGMIARDMLTDAGYVIEWKEYRGASHEIAPSEIMDLQSWMTKVLTEN